MAQYKSSHRGAHTLAAFLLFCFAAGVLLISCEKGIEDTYCRQRMTEVAMCNAENWRSAHCDQIFKEEQNDTDCRKGNK